jgi:lactate permease
VLSRTVPEFKSALVSVSLEYQEHPRRGRHQRQLPAAVPARRHAGLRLSGDHRAAPHALSDFVKAVRESSGTLLGAGFVLVFTVPMVRIMIQSGINANDLASMPISMANWVAGSVGESIRCSRRRWARSAPSWPAPTPSRT